MDSFFSTMSFFSTSEAHVIWAWHFVAESYFEVGLPADCWRKVLTWRVGLVLDALFVKGLRLVIFDNALRSAALIFFSSSESLTRESDSYSSTVFQPAGDLSTIRINLFPSFMSSRIVSIFFEDLFFEPDFISSPTFFSWSAMSSLKRNYFLLDLYLNSWSVFLLVGLAKSFFNEEIFSSKYDLSCSTVLLLSDILARRSIDVYL